MIDPKAIDHLIGRQRDDHTWVKELTEDQLDAEIELFETFKSLRQHQKACFLLGVANPQFFFMLDMGTGKTRLALALLDYWRRKKELRRAVIFVPNEPVMDSWVKEIDRVCPKMPFLVLPNGSSYNKWYAFDSFGEGLIIGSYPGIAAMCSELVPSSKKKGKAVRHIDKKLIKRFCYGMDAMILDESTFVANKGSLQFKVCEQVSWRTKFRYALAGRPFGRDPEMLWAQYFLLDHGETLGPTLGLFREAFFDKKPNFWGGPYSFDYTFRNDLVDDFRRIVAHRSISYRANECIDLPDTITQIDKVYLPDGTDAYRTKVIDMLHKAKGNHVEINNAFLRIRQISSGFLGYKDNDAKAEVELPANPKLEALLDRIEMMPKEAKAVVFYEFTWSGRKICEELDKLGIGYSWIWSGANDAQLEKNAFLMDPSVRVLVMNNKMGAFGIDGLQRVSNYMFFYESPVSPIVREQAERRLLRDGQEKPVFIFDLVTGRTLDERILIWHRIGGSLLEALTADPALELAA